jgi:hypothetical protein
MLLESMVKIASLEAKLRGIHLLAHLKQAALMTNEQVQKYQDLRGYESRSHTGHEAHHSRGDG